LEPGPRLDRILQQRCLSNARLPAYDEHPALPVERRREQPVERFALIAPPE
jgi:hypothetical protein